MGTKKQSFCLCSSHMGPEVGLEPTTNRLHVVPCCQRHGLYHLHIFKRLRSEALRPMDIGLLR